MEHDDSEKVFSLGSRYVREGSRGVLERSTYRGSGGPLESSKGFFFRWRGFQELNCPQKGVLPLRAPLKGALANGGGVYWGTGLKNKIPQACACPT